MSKCLSSKQSSRSQFFITTTNIARELNFKLGQAEYGVRGEKRRDGCGALPCTNSAKSSDGANHPRMSRLPLEILLLTSMHGNAQLCSGHNCPFANNTWNHHGYSFVVEANVQTFEFVAIAGTSFGIPKEKSSEEKCHQKHSSTGQQPPDPGGQVFFLLKRSCKLVFLSKSAGYMKKIVLPLACVPASTAETVVDYGLWMFYMCFYTDRN